MLEWKKDGWKAALALAPMLILMAVFTFYPIVNTIITSFKYYKVDAKGISDYIGWGINAYYNPNYKWGMESFEWIQTPGSNGIIPVLQDQKFWSAILFTVLLMVISVPLSIIIALLISTDV